MMSMINIFVIMMNIYIASTEASNVYIAYRKKIKCRVEDDGLVPMRKTLEMHESEEDALEHLHEKHIFDILA